MKIIRVSAYWYRADFEGCTFFARSFYGVVTKAWTHVFGSDEGLDDFIRSVK